jgi:hypothetical protein
MIQTRWCKYYVICSHCYNAAEKPCIMYIHDETFPETCDRCGQRKPYYTVEMVPGSWREEGYLTSEIWKAGIKK